MPIDLTIVNWAYVAILSLFAFVAALLGSLISFRNRFTGAIIAGILFAVAFVFWTYYPHENIPGPTSVTIAPSSMPPPATAPK
jgi:dolichyl-phosphate-mannose--protein O-mannosyl transferase